HESCDRELKIYQAEIINNCVIVTNSEDIERLYSQGYFGKGILSRSRPQYSVAEQELQISWRGSKPQFPNISSKKSPRHLEWAKELLKQQGLYLHSVTKLLDDYKSPLNLPEEDPPAASETPLEGDNGEESPNAKDAVEERDKESLEKMHSNKHDDLIAQCGCKPMSPRGPNQPIPRTLEDDKHEYVLVQEEEQSSEACEDDAKGETKKQLVCRRKPFKIFEYLLLNREEVFFLCYALDCLTVRYEKEPLTILKLCNPISTPLTWLITIFGARNFEGRPLRPLTWKSLAGLNKTTVNVSKELLFCFLIKSHGLTEKDLDSPGCMKKIKVQELILNRWIATRERMDQDEL
uniref:tRNA-splicing endonuclease subunit Sen2 n=1 Tax=Leptobrachium leishanense TaxID=445787 RepID=A0A8C5MY18_9ANUR